MLPLASVMTAWLPCPSYPYLVTVVVPPVTYQVPVNVLAGATRAGAAVYSSISLVRPRGSVAVDLITAAGRGDDGGPVPVVDGGGDRTVAADWRDMSYGLAEAVEDVLVLVGDLPVGGGPQRRRQGGRGGGVPDRLFFFHTQPRES